MLLSDGAGLTCSFTFPTKGFIQAGTGHQSQAVKAGGSLAAAEECVPPMALCVGSEKQAAQIKTGAEQHKIGHG